MLFATFILLAQGFNQQQFNQGFNQGFRAGDNIGGNICSGIHWLVYIGILVYFLIMNFNALSAVSPRNRDMEPGMVFLCLIPCFNLVWFFFVVSRVASSLEREFDGRGVRSDGDYGRTVGIIGGVLACICCTPGWMICAIIQAVLLHGYIAKLKGGGRRRKIRDDDDDDDDDDNRPRKRRGRDDDDDDDDDDRPRKRKRRRDDDDD